MKARKRLSRQESMEATRERLIEAAEKMFIRKGFDDASVEEISEAAGFSRGAFYSNFVDKDEVFLAVIDRQRPQLASALEDILCRIPEPVHRVAAVREWFSTQWRLRDIIALRLEFSRRATRNRRIHKHLADVWRHEFETYAACFAHGFAATRGTPAASPETVALAFMAVIHGLGSIAMDTGPEMEHRLDAAATLVFDRLSVPESSHAE